MTTAEATQLLEIRLGYGKWVTVTPWIFRSWSGERRIDGAPFTGPVFYLGTERPYGGPSVHWLTTCNACEAAPMVPGDPGGYCADCLVEANQITVGSTEPSGEAGEQPTAKGATP